MKFEEIEKWENGTRRASGLRLRLRYIMSDDGRGSDNIERHEISNVHSYYDDNNQYL